jgi:hypothetical protein
MRTHRHTHKQTQERKTLVAGGYRDKHFWWGSVLLGGGVMIAVEGALNTWTRTGACCVFVSCVSIEVN